jgi:transcriptional regulator with XRE-family HTH domain
MKNMLSHISSTAKSIWRKMRNKEYRDSFVASHISNTISAQIHSMRKERKWTQGDLADRCDMRQSRISTLEDPDFENVEIATLQRLASAFDVALSVRFVPFSEIAQRASTSTSSDFVVRDYSADTLEEQEASFPRIPHPTHIVIHPVIAGRKYLEVTGVTPDYSTLIFHGMPQYIGVTVDIPTVRH